MSEESASENADPTSEQDGWLAETEFSRRNPGQAVCQSDIWSLNAYLGQGYVDPFEVSAMKMTSSMNMYFHHCMHVVEISGIKNNQKLTQSSQNPHNTSMLPSRRYEDEYVVVAEGNPTASCSPGAPFLNSRPPGETRDEQRCLISSHQEVTTGFASSPR